MVVNQSQDGLLRSSIAGCLAKCVKSYDLPLVCEKLGLAPGEGSESFQSKSSYVKRRIDKYSEGDLITLASHILELYDDFNLLELLRKAKAGWHLRITELTRRDLLRDLLQRGPFSGRLEVTEFLTRLWPLDLLPSTDHRFDTLFRDILQHTCVNEDYDNEDLLDRVGILECSDEQFARFVELLAHPLVRREQEQGDYVGFINGYLRRDGFELMAVDEFSGYPVYALQSIAGGVEGRPKNLIFASTGPKPEIVIRDAINNTIEIVRYAEHILIYDSPIMKDGLTWSQLVAWWDERAYGEPADRALYKRLYQSLATLPEQNFLHAYFSLFKALNESLPALIPQVYLHYDPLTARQLGGTQRLLRQRMDFLMLLPHRVRIVLEVDGKHHYAEGDTASPTRYAEMVRADRELRLHGYEVFRFGATELLDKQTAQRTTKDFFLQLFDRHKIR
jgi:very-short-patch-repair endonuclease